MRFQDAPRKTGRQRRWEQKMKRRKALGHIDLKKSHQGRKPRPEPEKEEYE